AGRRARGDGRHDDAGRRRRSLARRRLMRLILLGAPGSGKGTQGHALAEHFGVTHLSTGDVLRSHIAAATDVGREVQGYVVRGELVPDDLMLQLVGGAVGEAARSGGYVLDGFPRTLAQAQRAYEL